MLNFLFILYLKLNCMRVIPTYPGWYGWSAKTKLKENIEKKWEEMEKK
jgi:hypothetical protein